MNHINWDTDREYAEGKVKMVTSLLEGMGWLVTVASPPWLGKSAKAHMVLPAGQCDQAPVEGETVRIFGSDERRVRGMVIEGRVYCYITAAEADEAEAIAQREREQERQKTLDDEREVRAARRALLPAPFQRRLDGFLSRGGERWRRDVEAFELDVLEVASRVVGLNPTHEAFYKFDDLPQDEQVKRVCGAGGTSLKDSAFQLAVGLAGFVVGGVGGLLPFLHGAACSEGLGCEICCCPSLRPDLLDSAEYAQARDALAGMLAERKRQGDDRAKDPAEALPELDAVIRKVRPHNGGDTGMSPPGSIKGFEVLFAGLAGLAGAKG